MCEAQPCAGGTARGLYTRDFVQSSQWLAGVGITIISISWRRKPEPNDTEEVDKGLQARVGTGPQICFGQWPGLSPGPWCVPSFQRWLWPGTQAKTCQCDIPPCVRGVCVHTRVSSSH